MPVQLTNAAFSQMLLGTGDIFAGRKVGDDLLPHPTTWQLASLRVREAPLEVLDCSIIGRLLTKAGWVVDVDLLVGTTCGHVSESKNMGILMFFATYRR